MTFTSSPERNLSRESILRLIQTTLNSDEALEEINAAFTLTWDEQPTDITVAGLFSYPWNDTYAWGCVAGSTADMTRFYAAFIDGKWKPSTLILTHAKVRLVFHAPQFDLVNEAILNDAMEGGLVCISGIGYTAPEPQLRPADEEVDFIIGADPSCPAVLMRSSKVDATFFTT